ncbi:hypothetical protein BGZ98_006653, partial [Dissophora globulifera]
PRTRSQRTRTLSESASSALPKLDRSRSSIQPSVIGPSSWSLSPLAMRRELRITLQSMASPPRIRPTMLSSTIPTSTASTTLSPTACTTSGPKRLSRPASTSFWKSPRPQTQLRRNSFSISPSKRT